MKNIILAQLASAEASVAAARALLEAWENGPPLGAPPAASEPDDGICRHPKEKRRSIATMGRPDAWMCLACGFQPDEES